MALLKSAKAAWQPKRFCARSEGRVSVHARPASFPCFGEWPKAI
ncbi:hypothetical protein A7982_12410 [Minicystis rosea]|nr:hypothetical protein A7982_12410 [Minicystis rosea]